jgi:serine/threonine-protein kinase
MPESVAHYRILEPLGAVPLGEQYRARDTRLGRTVAVTVIGDPIAGAARPRSALVEHARRLASLSHPNIAALYEAGEDEGRTFLAAEYVTGQPLATLTAGHSMNPRIAIEYGAQIADALAEAHAASLADGKLTADRILITPRGTVKIIDFGLAGWRLDSDAPASPTDRESQDLWALGLVLYQMLTGRQPRPGWPAPPPSSVNRSVPIEVDAILKRLLAFDRKDRYETAATACAELRSCGAVLGVRDGEAEPPSIVPAAAPARARTVWLAVALAIVAAALLWAALRAI